jgi:hypothetical protein
MYARFCPYHRELQHYVDLAVCVMKVCWRQLGVACALTFVDRAVERAAASTARVFVCGVQGEMGLCPICQEGYELGGYGVLACSHIMHLDCRMSYEAHEQGQAPSRCPGCPICRARFEGFVCICE